MPAYHLIRVVCDVCLNKRESTEHDDPLDLCSEHGWEYHSNGYIICAACQDERLERADAPAKSRGGA